LTRTPQWAANRRIWTLRHHLDELRAKDLKELILLRDDHDLNLTVKPPLDPHVNVRP
jgi:hypothetical protein